MFVLSIFQRLLIYSISFHKNSVTAIVYGGTRSPFFLEKRGESLNDIGQFLSLDLSSETNDSHHALG